MRPLRSLALLSASTLVPLALHAQTGTPSVTGGTVSGRVICADTNAPARFGRVYLKSTHDEGWGDIFTKRMQSTTAANGRKQPSVTEEQKRTQAAAARTMNHAGDLLSSATIGMNGEYSFPGLKPGTYYVHAVYRGYVDSLANFSDEDLASTDPAVMSRISSAVSTITITGDEEVHVDLRLDRGAAVSGKVLYDDGSPAVGWIVTLEHAKDQEEFNAAIAMQQQLAVATGDAAITDDQGRYRVSGLAPGEYVVRAYLQALAIGVSLRNPVQGGDGTRLLVYSGDTFHRKSAKSFQLSGSTERSGTDLTVPSHTLHSLVGHVIALSDGHTLNSGTVILTSKEDSEVSLKAGVRDDGSFHYDYLPSGTYTLKASDVADARTTSRTNLLGMSIPNQEILRKYADATAEVVLQDSDTDSVRLSVAQTDWTPPAKKAGAKEVDTDTAVGGALGKLFTTDEDDAGDKPKEQPKPQPKP